MPYTLEQLAAETKVAFDKHTEGLSLEQKQAVADLIFGWLGDFPPREVKYTHKTVSIDPNAK